MTKGFQIFIHGLEGKSTIYSITQNTSVDELMKMVEDKTGVEVDSQRIIFVGKQLRPGCFIRDYDIRSNSTLFLVVRLHGGSGEEPSEKRHDPNDDDDVELTTAPDMITRDDDPENPRAKMPCGHAIGPESLTAYCRSIIDAGKFQFFCPYVGAAAADRCKLEWHYRDVRKLGLLSNEEERYFETKISQNFLLLAEGIQQCPKCQSYCERRDKDRRATICVICTRRDQKEYMFCWFCLHLMISYSQCTNAECLGIEPRLAILRNAPLKSIMEVRNVPSRRACPKCGLLVEHDRDCKHIKCRCDHKFCFVCLKPCLNGVWQCGVSNAPCEIAPVQTTIPSPIDLKEIF